jgi:hypothetical protein
VVDEFVGHLLISVSPFFPREIALFYIWPVAVLFYLKTSYIAIVYLIGVGISGVRRYFNIVAVIEETGTMKLISGKSRSQSWLKQSRLTDIVDKISTDKSKRVWLTILGIFGFVFLVLFFSGLLGEQNGDTGDEVTLSKFIATFLVWKIMQLCQFLTFNQCLF